VSLKKLSVAAVAVLACVTGLSACSDNHGAAAFVSDSRISDSSINKYLTREGPDATSANQESPRVSTLTELILEQVFTDALAKTGGVPTAAEREAVHEDARSLLLRDSNGNPMDDATLTQLSSSYGLGQPFADLLATNAELEYIYIERSKVQNPTELSASIAKLNIPVTVNASYGAWDTSAMLLNTDPAAGRPSFITFHVPATPQATASSGAAG
jgi:hypothetical protein